jgi:2'-5' RNA ligase
MQEPTRVFIGIPVDGEIMDLITSLPYLADLPATWVRREDLHLTILPPWNTKDLEKEKERLRFLDKRFIHFPLFFHTVETTPRNSPRIIWLRSDMIGSLSMIKQEIKTIFQREDEERPLLPHITLGRMTKSENSIAISEQIPVSIIATKLVLYISHRTPDGAWYEPAETISFT